LHVVLRSTKSGNKTEASFGLFIESELFAKAIAAQQAPNLIIVCMCLRTFGTPVKTCVTTKRHSGFVSQKMPRLRFLLERRPYGEIQYRRKVVSALLFS
jgi:hypothetical protein